MKSSSTLLLHEQQESLVEICIEMNGKCLVSIANHLRAAGDAFRPLCPLSPLHFISSLVEQVQILQRGREFLKGVHCLSFVFIVLCILVVF